MFGYRGKVVLISVVVILVVLWHLSSGSEEPISVVSARGVVRDATQSHGVQQPGIRSQDPPLESPAESQFPFTFHQNVGDLDRPHTQSQAEREMWLRQHEDAAQHTLSEIIASGNIVQLGHALSAPWWRNKYFDTNLGFSLVRGHHNQQLGAIVASAMAMDMGVKNMLLPPACSRERFDKEQKHNLFRTVRLDTVFDMDEVTEKHRVRGVKIVPSSLAKQHGYECSYSAPTLPQESGITFSIPIKFSHLEFFRFGWKNWTQMFWIFKAKYFMEKLRSIPASKLAELVSKGQIPVVISNFLNVLYPMFADTCRKGYYCLKQPLPLESIVLAAQMWPYQKYLQIHAQKVIRKLGGFNHYGFIHLRIEKDQPYSSRQEQFDTMKKLLQKYPHINWYVATGVFRPGTYEDDEFVNQVRQYRKERSWCTSASTCGVIYAGDEMFPEFLEIPSDTRSIIDQLVGREAYVAAGIPQSSMTSSIYMYRVIQYNTSRTLFTPAPVPKPRLVEHTIIFPVYSKAFFQYNGLDFSSIPCFEHTLRAEGTNRTSLLYEP
eukprot:PhF_6_TR12946/c0_g1_i2/m.20433